MCFFLVIPLAPAFGSSECSKDIASREKKIINKYLFFKQLSHCKSSPEDLLALSKQAYLAGDYSIGIWAAESGLKNKGKLSLKKNAELSYFLGLCYIGKNRNEEAIKVLRNIVYAENTELMDQEILQKSHLALIEAYHQKKNDRENEGNISYLIRLFKNRYKNSDYVYALHDWNNQRYGK